MGFGRRRGASEWGEGGGLTEGVSIPKVCSDKPEIFGRPLPEMIAFTEHCSRTDLSPVKIRRYLTGVG